MPEAQLTEPLDRAAEKGGLEEVFAALEAAVKADVEAFQPGERECAGLRVPLAESSPSSARDGEPGREDSFGAAFEAAFAAEVAPLVGPRRADGQDFEALEQALRRRALGLAAQALAQYSTRTMPTIRIRPSRAPAAERRATPPPPRPSPRCSGR